MANDKSFTGAVNGVGSYELFNPMDIYLDEEYQKATRQVPYMSSLSWLNQIAGFHTKRKVRRSEWSFYEEGQFMKAACTIAAIAANGAMFDITISAADHNLSGTASFPVEGQTCMFVDGKTHGRVNTINRTTPNAHVVTVKKLNPSQDIAAVALVGTVVVFYGNAQVERSRKTESRVDLFDKVTNKMQIIREHYSTSDLEMQNATRFQASNGKTYLLYNGIEKTAERFEYQREAAVLVTPSSSGLTDKNNANVQTAFGLIPQIEQNGINIEYFDEPDMADFFEVILALDNNYAEKSYMVGHGINVMLKIQNWLTKFAQGGTGNVSFSPFNGGAEQALSLNFKSMNISAYDFHFQQWSLFSHKDSLGAPGLPYRNMAIFMPSGKTRNADPGADNATYEPYIQLVTPTWGRGLNSNIDKGDYLMWETGALGVPVPTDDELGVGIHWAAYLGLELRCRHKFAKWEIA